MYYKTTYAAPIGLLTLACDGEHLTGLWTQRQKYHGETLFPDMVQREDCAVFRAAAAWLDAYFAGERPAPAQLPLAPAGSAFRQAVWRILCDIPYGSVITYGEIAASMAKQMHRATMSAQAVGGAVGHNPISIIIPCHRVIGTNGSLTGYAAGIAVKEQLLTLEQGQACAFG